MDENELFREQSGSFSIEPLTPPEKTPRKKPHMRRGAALCLAALVFALGGLAIGLQQGLTLRFDRLEGGFTLLVPDAQSGAPEQPSAPQSSTLATVTVTDSSPTGQLPAAAPDENVQLTLATEGADLSWQQVYQSCRASVVSITAAGAGASTTGSGIVLTADGYLATNAHVIDGALQITVTLADDSTFSAALVGADEATDLAVLKIDAAGLTAATFGDSDSLLVGDSVAAIGDPLGSELRGTMTDGIICGIGRDMQVDGRAMTLLQTNAALNEGNSGGPLLNQKGQVIGINTMKLSSAYASIEGLGFAIPSATALPVLRELIAQGYVSGRPDFGFDGMTVPSYAQFYYRLPAGVYIQSVDEGSDAQALGLGPGDVVTAVEGTAIYDLEDLSETLTGRSAGDEVTLTVYHLGSYYYVELTLAEAAP